MGSKTDSYKNVRRALIRYGRRGEFCIETSDTSLQLAEKIRLLRRKINTEHMESGVNIIDPDHTYIDESVRIVTGALIYPGAILEGRTIIGANCVIGANTRIVGSTLGESVEVWYSVVMDSVIGNFTTIGPFAYIRPGNEIGSHVRIGDFVEIKNSNIGDRTSISHLTYIGDSDVGSRVNFGCGAVTVNYDGTTKYRTVVGDNAFIGCNTNLIAPVKVGDGAYTAAGSTITLDVPGQDLAVARARQTNISGYAKRYLKSKGEDNK